MKNKDSPKLTKEKASPTNTATINGGTIFFSIQRVFDVIEAKSIFLFLFYYFL